MKVYDLKGMFLSGKEAIVAVALPKPKKNAYAVSKIYNVSDKGNKIVIHLKDLSKPPLKVTDDNLEFFTIEFDGKDFDGFDFTKVTDAALIHHNADDLPEGKSPFQIFDEVFKEPIVTNDNTGKGTIRP